VIHVGDNVSLIGTEVYYVTKTFDGSWDGYYCSRVKIGKGTLLEWDLSNGRCGVQTGGLELFGVNQSDVFTTLDGAMKRASDYQEQISDYERKEWERKQAERLQEQARKHVGWWPRLRRMLGVQLKESP
jgi:hypothetical protein